MGGNWKLYWRKGVGRKWGKGGPMGIVGGGGSGSGWLCQGGTGGIEAAGAGSDQTAASFLGAAGTVHPEVVPTGLLVHPSELVQAREVVLRECCESRVADPSVAPGRGGSIRVVDPSAARVGPRNSVPTSV